MEAPGKRYTRACVTLASEKFEGQLGLAADDTTAGIGRSLGWYSQWNVGWVGGFVIIVWQTRREPLDAIGVGSSL